VNNKELYKQTVKSCLYAFITSLPQILFLHSGFIHAAVFIVTRSINAVVKQISKKFHLKSPYKIGVGRNITHWVQGEGGG